MSAAAGVCFQFEKNGKCSYGKDCKFAHGPDDPKHKEGGPKSAAPAENAVAAAPGTPSSSSKASTTTSSTGGTGSPVKEKGSATERRADSPAAMNSDY